MLKKLFSQFKQKRFYGSSWNGFTAAREQWNVKKYLGTYADSVYVYSAVRKRAEKVGQIEFELYKGDIKQEKNDLLNVLYKPNKHQSKNEFFELYQIYKDLAGSTYVYIEKDGKRLVGLHNLRPDWIKELRSKADGSIVGYEYGQGDKKIALKPEEVLASHYPSPTQSIGGHSPIQTARNVIDTQIQLEEYQVNILRNGGRVEGIINVKTDYLTEEQIKELKAQFAKGYAGAKKSGLPFFAYGGMEYSNLGMSPLELSYIESKKFTRADILAVYGVPLPIIDTSDVGALGSNGYDAALKIFLQETIDPLLDNLTQKLNEFLVEAEFELKYLKQTEEDVEKKLKVVESGIKNSYMTVNEAREAMGLTPLKGQDVLLTPFNLMPQDTIEKHLGDNCCMPKKKSQFEHPLRDKAFREQYYKDYKRGLNKDIQMFKRALNGYLEAQKDRVLGNEKKDFVSDRFNIGEENRLGIALFTPILEQIFIDAGQQIFDLFGGDTFTLKPRMRESLEKRAEFFVTEINNTTFKEMQELFENAQIDGLTRAELIDEVADLYDNRITDTRAEMIVRTETHHAIEEGKLEGYRDVGVPIKIWVHNPVSQDPRIEHMAIDGEEQLLDNPFSNGLQYPGDGGPEDSINCSCTI
jgi:HK97 family phage portal protein